MCISEDLNYLDENGVNILLEAPKPSYDLNIQNYLNSNENKKIFQITCNYKDFDFKNIPHFISLQNFYINIRKDNGLVLVLLKNKYIQNESNRKLIIYCHENKRDIGELIPTLIDLTIQFRSDLLTFDYSGFGRSSGKIQKCNFYLNCKKIYNYVIKYFKYHSENIIIFGREIGAISALIICMNYSVKCAIIFSPIFLGIIGQNLLKGISVPVFLIQHNAINSEYNYKKTSELCSQIRNIHKWTCNRNSFEKILKEKRPKLINKIKGYINKIKNNLNKSNLNTSYESKNLKEMNTNISYSQLGKKVNQHVIVFSDDEDDEN